MYISICPFWSRQNVEYYIIEKAISRAYLPRIK